MTHRLIIFLTLSTSFLSTGCSSQKCNKKPESIGIQKSKAAKQNKELVVEAACGQCLFDLPGKGCDLAIRFNGHAYYVDGTEIDAHGDAHAEDGFCNAVRKAKVQGHVDNGRFNILQFNLVSEAP